MPIFEYRCLDCKNEFEQFSLSLNSVEQVECPLCKSIKIEKIISLSSFRLKGNGWYQTDFKEQKGKE